MRNHYYIKITVNDPYPKHFEERAEATSAGTAVRRAIDNFREKEWRGRPLKEATIQLKLL